MNKKIVVIGGAFNPVTYAHLALAEQITNEYDIDKVIFLPVGDLYPKKDLINSTHRVQMLKEVCKKNNKFSVSEIETNSKVLLYTIDSLRLLKSQYPEYDIIFAMGTDNLIKLSTWQSYDELMQNYIFMIIERNGSVIDSIINFDPLLYKYKTSIIKIKENIRNDGNSSYVRKLLKENKSIKYLVPEEVETYIKSNNLFK